jgi:hypothetical protein
MTKSIYRTAQGKQIDMGKLALQNEKVRAVGNMKVNARGDAVDDHNRVIETKNQQVSRNYRNKLWMQMTEVTHKLAFEPHRIRREQLRPLNDAVIVADMVF